MPNLLLELFSEELPAGMQPKAEGWLRENLVKQLEAAKLVHGEVKTFRTPRRIAILVHDLPDHQPDTSEERKGPATSAPDQALQGFLKSTGLSKDQLETREIKGKDYYFAVMHEKGKPTAEALKSLLEELLPALPWPKSMRWGDYALNWARPLQNICCLLDSEVIPLTLAHLTANSQTYGHRFLAPEALTVPSPEAYEELLRGAHVIADGDAREAMIAKELQIQAKDCGLELMEDPALLREVTGLVEWPVILQGSIDDQFMSLPPEVMRSEMRNHQKYFTLCKPLPSGEVEERSDSGEGAALPANKFLITSNLIASDGGKAVISGNERVLRARLSDGQFFYQQDQKIPLEQWNEKLKSVVFHAKLGTVADKVERVKTLAADIATAIGTDATKATRAAELCKADLATGMVGEFPELQGIMGYYYATAQGEEAEVAAAIRDHYLPLGPNSPVPTEPTSIAVALADKLDSLVSLFSAGEAPTGSKDPFALRRAALGVIRIILENKLRLPLATLFNPSHGEGSKSPISGEGISDGRGILMDFILDRLRGVLKDKGLRYDVIEAVLHNTDEDDLLRISQKVETLQQFIDSQDATSLLTAYNRAANILAKSEQTQHQRINAELLKENEEIALHQALEKTSQLVERHLQDGEYDKALAAFAGLRQPVDAFFDHVTVNAEDNNLRHNRLSLLSNLVDNMQSIADFSQIQQAA